MLLKKWKLPAFLILTILNLYSIFANVTNLNPMYAEGAFYWCFTITCYVGLWGFFKVFAKLGSPVFEKQPGSQPFVLKMPEFSLNAIPKNIKTIIAVPWIIFVIVVFISSVLFNWKAYRDQLGEEQVKSFSSEIQTVDLSQIPVVDQALATKLADKKLGERPSLGSQVVLGTPVIQRVNEKLVWVVPLYHSGLFKWLSNMDGTPGYVVVSASNVNDVEYVEKHKIKFHPGSYLMYDLRRQVRFLDGALLTGITDYSFELDDAGVPYWVVTTYKNLRGFSLPEATGTIVVNASTGESHRYSLAQTPSWVDRVQPVDFIVQQITNKGEYVHGFLNFSDRDKYGPSQGQAIVYNNGRCYLFTGLTSVGTDESAIGFVMIDMVTKESRLYQMNGATEYAAQNSAKGKVQHLGYYASFPLIINVDGQPTYFMSLKDKEGLIKQYAFVSVVNYSTVGVGETMQLAMRDYEQGLKNSGSTLVTDNTKKGERTVVEGNVFRIASEYNGSETVYMIILEDKRSVIFTLPSNASSQLALTKEGDRVSIVYNNDGKNSPVIAATSFENLALKQG